MSPEAELAITEIERLAALGDGVGRLADGRVVFVPFAAPGDRVRVRVEETHPRWARAALVELLEPGPARTEPPCPVFGECGGCAWQHLRYDAQLEAKRGIVEDALRRIAGVEPPGPVEVVPSPEPYAYRGRARLLAAGGKVGYRRRRSHALCPVERCPVLVPKLEARLARLARHGSLRDGEIELFEGTLSVGPDTLRVSHGVFAQANALLLPDLAEAVVAAAAGGARRTALELFAGAGTFTLGLARRFERVEAVEGHPRAADDLRANLAAAGLANVDVRRASVEAALAARAGAPGEPPDCVVLDPPRSGLAKDAVAALAGLGAPRVVYLSCDPATLARDLGALRAESPLRLARARAFDLFPQTAHVEVLAVLEAEPR